MIKFRYDASCVRLLFLHFLSLYIDCKGFKSITIKSPFERIVEQKSFLNEEVIALLDRRKLLQGILPCVTSITTDSGKDRTVDRSGKGFSYFFTPPLGFTSSNKPLKTHLDEINFFKEDERGYKYGITVDPVRISNLREFGSPEEVAQRVIQAESVRDGVTDVRLFQSPKEDVYSNSYEISFISQGSRGNNHVVNRIYVDRNMLYVITAQIKVSKFEEKGDEIMTAINSFVLGQK